VGLQEYTDGRIINGIDLDDYYASEGRAEVFNNHLVITMENRRKLDSGVYRYFYDVYDFYNVGNTKLNIPAEYYLAEEQIEELNVHYDYYIGGVRYGKHLVSTYNSPYVLMAHTYMDYYQQLIVEPGVHYVYPNVYGNPIVRVVYYYYTERPNPAHFMTGYTLNVYFDKDGYYQGEYADYDQVAYKASEFVSKGGAINFYDQWANS
ncbi:MAG: hypothetical protein K6C32_04125, partial [Bacilli bacterium]|nr:hypothetical protein [Bacilli bacterium]